MGLRLIEKKDSESPDESVDALRRLGERIENYRSDCSVIVKSMIIGTSFILGTFAIFYLIWLFTER